MCCDIGFLPVLLCGAFQHRGAQRLDAVGRGQVIATRGHRVQRVVERAEHVQIGRRSGRAGIGRKAEQHDGELALGHLSAAQRHQTPDAFAQLFDPLGAGCHRLDVALRCAVVAATGAARRTVASGEDRRIGRAVQLGQGDQHRGLDRPQPLRRMGPLRQRLELQRMRRDIGHVEPFQHFDRRVAVIIGWPADKAEPGQRQQRVDLCTMGVAEEGLDGGTPVQPRRKAGENPQPARLERPDHGVVMCGVARQHIAAHQEHADRAVRPIRSGQIGGIFGDPALQIGVIKPGLGIFLRRGHMPAAPFLDMAVARDQKADHRLDIVVRAAQPVLHHQEPRPQILRLARDQLEHARHPLEHAHLARAVLRRGLGRAPQLLQQLAGGRGGCAHVERAHPCQLHDLRIRDHADHRVAIVAPCLHVGHDRIQVLFEKQQRRDDDVGAGDGGARGLQRIGAFAPFGSGVHGHLEAGEFLGHAGGRLGAGACGMRVERDDGDAVARRYGQVI